MSHHEETLPGQSGEVCTTPPAQGTEAYKQAISRQWKDIVRVSAIADEKERRAAVFQIFLQGYAEGLNEGASIAEAVHRRTILPGDSVTFSTRPSYAEKVAANIAYGPLIGETETIGDKETKASIEEAGESPKS